MLDISLFIFNIKSAKALSSFLALVSPYWSIFLTTSNIGIFNSFAICSIVSIVVFPIPLFGSFIILFKLTLSFVF